LFSALIAAPAGRDADALGAAGDGEGEADRGGEHDLWGGVAGVAGALVVASAGDLEGVLGLIVGAAAVFGGDEPDEVTIADAALVDHLVGAARGSEEVADEGVFEGVAELAGRWRLEERGWGLGGAREEDAAEDDGELRRGAVEVERLGVGGGVEAGEEAREEGRVDGGDGAPVEAEASGEDALAERFDSVEGVEARGEAEELAVGRHRGGDCMRMKGSSGVFMRPWYEN
jgi:hypothetical protein